MVRPPPRLRCAWGYDPVPLPTADSTLTGSASMARSAPSGFGLLPLYRDLAAEDQGLHVPGGVTTRLQHQPAEDGDHDK